MVWDLSNRERLAIRNFKVWELGSWSVTLQVWPQLLDILD